MSTHLRSTLRSLAFTAALLAMAPVTADEPSSAPVIALRTFFNAVAGEDYASAWKGFTRKSQQVIIQSIADSEKMSATDVEQLFSTNAQSIQAGFWTNFRQSSQADTLVGLAMRSAGPQRGAEGSVEITLSDGRVATLLMYKEGRKWKVGWTETFFPSGAISPAAQ